LSPVFVAGSGQGLLLSKKLIDEISTKKPFCHICREINVLKLVLEGLKQYKMFFLEFVLKTRVKYLALGLLFLFCVILFLTSSGDHRAEEEHLDLIQYKKNIAAEVKRKWF
jgi:hypothetical protein